MCKRYDVQFSSLYVYKDLAVPEFHLDEIEGNYKALGQVQLY